MTDLRLVKTNFTAGEISPQLLARGDLRAYENGARTLKNVAIHPTGGLTRRQGTYFIDTALGDGRLISFEFNADQTYLLAVTNGKITIYRNGLKLANVDAPWNEAQIKNLTWAQSADTVLLCHPDVPPKKLLRQSDTNWTLSDWRFTKVNMNVQLQPYYKFVDEEITITPSNTFSNITLNASAPVFVPGHVNTYLRIKNKNVMILSYVSSTVVNAFATEFLVDTATTPDWQEQVFSAVRGYPICAAFHQDRLIIGGSRDLPNRLWMSCSGDLWNFNKGTGLDSDAIEFGLFSDQINAIRALFSGRHLQVFTSGAEWIVTGDPLTPVNIQLVRQTRIGSITNRYVPPVDVDGATLFAGRTGRELREFIYADVEQAYQANDLAMIARHFIVNPVDQCFDPLQRILFMPLADGTVAALTIYRTESVFAWCRLETNGAIISIAMIGAVVYLLVKRNNTYFIERFDETILLDAALSGTSQNPTATWSGLNHLNNREVMVIGDGVVLGMKTVVNNQLVLDHSVRSLSVGLPYEHVIEPLPPSVMSTDGSGRAIRLVRAIFRMHETRALKVDTGNGLKQITLHRPGHNEALENFTGDIGIHAFGWTSDNTKPLWRIAQNTPLPCTILGVTMELKVND
ncbi:MAG: hypothetical protein JWM96_220 [Alphaproteobacteria bacterium]|nr:hypothetical protein [Alphaproteobacteria bacterium]